MHLKVKIYYFKNVFLIFTSTNFKKVIVRECCKVLSIGEKEERWKEIRKESGKEEERRRREEREK